MKEFMAEYGSVVVTVIIVLAVCAFVGKVFTPQLQTALTDTLTRFFKESGAGAAGGFIGILASLIGK